MAKLYDYIGIFVHDINRLSDIALAMRYDINYKISTANFLHYVSIYDINSLSIQPFVRYDNKQAKSFRDYYSCHYCVGP